MARIIEFAIPTSVKIRRDESISEYCRCRHEEFEINCLDKLVYCAKCGARLDPFFVLEQLAKGERKLLFQEAEAKAAIEEFKKIESQWKLSTRERRRIAETKTMARLELASELAKGAK